MDGEVMIRCEKIKKGAVVLEKIKINEFILKLH